MDILILNWKDIKNPEMGGAEIILYELSKRLIREGHTVTWFSRMFVKAKKEEYLEGIRTIRSGNILTVYFMAFLFYRQLHKKPDIVLDCLNTLAWQTPLYIPKEKIRFYVNQLAREVFFYELPRGIADISNFLERWQFLPYKNIRTVCYSASVKQDLVEYGFDPSSIALFPMGLDHDRYVPGKKSKSPLFVFVARLVKMKRADLVIKAFREVVNSHPDATLAVVGYGKEERNLSELITSLRLNDNCRIVNKNNVFFRKDSRDLKLKFLQEAWALILPSVKEGWGMVVTEAASCSTPSIVTDVTGLRDSVIDGKTGLRVSKNPSSHELAYAMMRLISEKQLRLDMSIAAYKYSQRFSWEGCYERFCSSIGL